MLILIADAFDASLPGQLEQFGTVTTDPADAAKADIILVRSKTKCTKEYIDAAPKLKLIIRGGVGIDNIDSEYAKSKGIMVRNTPKASSVAVAELAVSLMLGVCNQLQEAWNSMDRGEWKKKEIKRTELNGKTLALMGIGNIATQVAIRAKAFGMRVVAFDAFVKHSDHAELLPTAEEAILQADYVSLHLPLTDGTKGMIGKEILDKLTKQPVFINTGRAGVVDAEAMVAALESGKVGVYATDVWSKDPPPADELLLNAPRVLKTPHIGGSTKENLGRIGAEALAIVKEFVEA